MKELTVFFFPECPYCRQAFRWHEEIFREHPEYKNVPLRLIDEHKEAALADSYDYWYVPTVFLGHELRIRCIPAVDHQYFIVADNDGGIRLAYVHEDDTQEGFLGPCPVYR